MSREAIPDDARPPGIVLAGGRSQRMGGGDKALLPLGGRTVLAHVLERLRPQVSALALNVNGDPTRFGDQQLPMLADSLGGSRGPLAGILTGLEWAAASAPHATHLVTAPCDTPFLPRDLVVRLVAALPEHEVACAASRGQLHGTVGLWPVGMAADLRAALGCGAAAGIADWLRHYLVAVVDFADSGGVDPFLNINRPEDLVAAQHALETR